MRATFIIKEELLTKIRDYAYTERIGISEAVNKALEMFLADKKDLLHREER